MICIQLYWHLYVPRIYDEAEQAYLEEPLDQTVQVNPARIHEVIGTPQCMSQWWNCPDLRILHSSVADMHPNSKTVVSRFPQSCDEAEGDRRTRKQTRSSEILQAT